MLLHSNLIRRIQQLYSKYYTVLPTFYIEPKIASEGGSLIKSMWAYFLLSH